MNDSVTTANKCACRSACPVLVEAWGIARFDTAPNHTIATEGQSAVVQTGICVILIPIIARLKPWGIGIHQVASKNTVATIRRGAVIEAGVSGVGVAVVTSFARVDYRIATARPGAFAITAITLFIVAVVALLGPGPNETVTTAGPNTGIQAVIVVAEVAVVTLLKAWLVGIVDVEANETVAAMGGQARAQACVVVVEVSVVAFLPGLFQAVTAGRQPTKIGAAINVDIVAIIASLDAQPHQAVSTSSQDAVGQAAVGVVEVSVVAFLLVLYETVTAVAQDTRVEAVVVWGCVAIIATFTRLHDAVTAPWEGAGTGAPVVIDLVSVVTRLGPAQDVPVSASGKKA